MKTQTLNFSRALVMACATLAVTIGITVLPMQHAVAQTRALPDFTDLVEQVGPSVVNIRTLERVVQRQQQGASPADEEMLCLAKHLGPTAPNKKKSNPVVWALALSCPPMA
jgi:serine protease Do